MDEHVAPSFNKQKVNTSFKSPEVNYHDNHSRNFSLEINDRYKLKNLRKQIETSKNSKNREFRDRLKDLKFSYILKPISTNLDSCASSKKALKNLSALTFTTEKKKEENEFKFKGTSMGKNIKWKVFDIMNKTKEFSAKENGKTVNSVNNFFKDAKDFKDNSFTNDNSNSNRKNNYSDFQFYDTDTKFSNSSLKFNLNFNQSSNSKGYESPNLLRQKKEEAKKELVNLINNNPQRENKINRLKMIQNDDNGIVENKTKLSLLSTGKFKITNSVCG